MGQIVRGTKAVGGVQFQDGAGKKVLAAEVNVDFDTAYTEINGLLDNTNVKANAAIAASKLNLSAFLKNIHINANANINGSKLKAASIPSGKLIANSVGIAQLAPNSVALTKISDSDAAQTMTVLSSTKSSFLNMTLPEITGMIITETTDILVFLSASAEVPINNGDWVVSFRAQADDGVGGTFESDDHMVAIEETDGFLGDFASHHPLNFMAVIEVVTAGTYTIRIQFQTNGGPGGAATLKLSEPIAWLTGTPRIKRRLMAIALYR